MPVQLDLSELLHTPGMRKPFDAEIPCSPELELACESPITGHLVFTNTGNVLVVQGTASVTLRFDVTVPSGAAIGGPGASGLPDDSCRGRFSFRD